MCLSSFVISKVQKRKHAPHVAIKVRLGLLSRVVKHENEETAVVRSALDRFLARVHDGRFVRLNLGWKRNDFIWDRKVCVN